VLENCLRRLKSEFSLAYYVDGPRILKPIRIKTTDAAKLQDEYAKLVEGLQESLSDQNDTDPFMGNPGKFLPETGTSRFHDILQSTSGRFVA
jgi:hypothetical protein